MTKIEHRCTPLSKSLEIIVIGGATNAVETTRCGGETLRHIAHVLSQLPRKVHLNCQVRTTLIAFWLSCKPTLKIACDENRI